MESRRRRRWSHLPTSASVWYAVVVVGSLDARKSDDAPRYDSDSHFLVVLWGRGENCIYEDAIARECKRTDIANL